MEVRAAIGEDVVVSDSAKTVILAFIIVFFLATIGCSKLNQKNYDQLKVGMSYGEVVALLGEADTCDGAMGIKNCTWGNDEKHVKVSFAGNKVIIFSGKGL